MVGVPQTRMQYIDSGIILFNLKISHVKLDLYTEQTT